MTVVISAKDVNETAVSYQCNISTASLALQIHRYPEQHVDIRFAILSLKKHKASGVQLINIVHALENHTLFRGCPFCCDDTPNVSFDGSNNVTVACINEDCFVQPSGEYANYEEALEHWGLINE